MNPTSAMIMMAGLPVRLRVLVPAVENAVSGNAFQWAYTLRLPVDGKVYEVQFDDWMYLVDERVMLNKAVMSKFGIRLGEVTLSMRKLPQP